MKRKAKTISNEITEIISGWKGIAAIVMGINAEIETYDPYFSIDLDIYFRGYLIPSNDRREQLKNPGGFETSPIYPIDRFLKDELPVSIHYKDVSRINLLLKRVQEQSWVFRRESTNVLYRIEKGQVLYSQGTWFDELRSSFKEIPDGFWKGIIKAARFSLDQHLNGIGAAVYRNDNLYYQISASGFCTSLCSYVFAMNKRFEPSARLLHEHIKKLEQLPPEFLGRFESFIRPDAELKPSMKYEIAKLLARSLSD